MTAVPQPTFGPQGFIAPAESAILTGITADINAAFGGNLNPAPTTPQGQLAVSEAAIIGAINDLFLFYTSSDRSGLRGQGRMQDAIGRIYFIERNPGAANCSSRCSASVRRASRSHANTCKRFRTLPATSTSASKQARSPHRRAL